MRLPQGQLAQGNRRVRSNFRARANRQARVEVDRLEDRRLLASQFVLAPNSPFQVGILQPADVAVGDFNGDGVPDLAYSNFATPGGPGPDSSQTSVVKSASASLDPPSGPPLNQVSIMQGRGDGTFSPAPGSPIALPDSELGLDSIAVGEFDGDNLPDLAVLSQFDNTVTILKGLGNGQFSVGTPTPTGGFLAERVVVGNFDGDNHPDLAVVSNGQGPGEGTVTILKGLGNDQFSAGAPIPTGGSSSQGIAVGEFDGDNLPDLAVTSETNPSGITILKGLGNDQFQPQPLFSDGGRGPSQVAVGEFNGDGHPDLAVSNFLSGNVSILLGQGNDAFMPAPGSPYATGSGPTTDIAVGELDNDNHLDFVAISPQSIGIITVGNRKETSLTPTFVYKGLGNGQFVPMQGSPFPYPGQIGPSFVALGDFNRDGETDIALASLSEMASVLLNTSDALVSAHSVNVSAVEGEPADNVAVASFVDPDQNATAAEYAATIDWGDGSTPSAGDIARTASGTFFVTGRHTYVDARVSGGSGSFPITVTIADKGGASTTVTSAATVADLPITLTGQLNPASDSGAANFDKITNINQPNFFGTSEANSTIRLFASRSDQAGYILIGQTQAESSGAWSITSTHLADGSYTILATAIDHSGFTSAITQLLPMGPMGPLVIDTVAPRVSGIAFNRLTGQLFVFLQDNRGGLDQQTVTDGANYIVTKPHTLPGAILVTNIHTAAPPVPNLPQLVVLRLNRGRRIKGGTFFVTILSGGIADLAGNPLDGEFFGPFPSGDGRPGGLFQARILAIHDRAFPAIPLASTSRSNSRII
jgi:hypothetical protein